MSELTTAFDSENGPTAEGPTVCSMDVPDRKELIEKAMSAPSEAWNKAREALADPDTMETWGNLVPEIRDLPQDSLEWLKGSWEDQTENFKLWWHGSE